MINLLVEEDTEKNNMNDLQNQRTTNYKQVSNLAQFDVQIFDQMATMYLP